ncbi:hypothetical protein Z042_23125 [Chania multitudinisentens RB-25]|uniref:Uncharacterized protein n=1 Tax=Chania multitudinisentens RB-25 TaxID=1441930 RepID=W0LLS1_9GAMM|nr:hypothetical protein [Chania multitudinisentens]AHG22995.1 hypothetical protein Z042_23125 [Chania multitudinisentens RB-25]
MSTSARKYDIFEAASFANENAKCDVHTSDNGIEIQWAWKNGIFDMSITPEQANDDFASLREIFRSAREMRGMDFLPALESQIEIITAMQLAAKGIKADKNSELALGALQKGIEALTANIRDLIKDASPKD